MAGFRAEGKGLGFVRKEKYRQNSFAFMPRGILLLVLFAGAATMVLEIAGSRLLSMHYGNTIYLWASQIAVVLGALSAGYYLGGKWADSGQGRQLLIPRLALAGIWIAATPFVASLALPNFIYFGTMLAPLLGSLLLFAYPIFVLGCITPLAIHEACEGGKQVAGKAGLLYAISTVASIAGTLAAGFVILPSLGLTLLFALLGACTLLACGLFSKSRLLLLLPAAILLAAWFYPHSPSAIYEADSPYYHLRVVQQGDVRSLLLDADTHSSARLGSTDLVYSYTILQSASLRLSPNPKRVLFLGLGGGSMPEYFLANSDAAIDIVEIDPKVVEVSVRYFGLPESGGRLSIHTQDARQFLLSSNEKYDIIVLDAYSSHYSVPSHLLTSEFFALASSRLDENGIASINLISPPGDGLAPHVLSGMQGSFASVVPMCTSPVGKMQNIVIFASKHKGEGFASLSAKFSPAQSERAYPCQINGGAPAFTDDWAPTDYVLAQTLS